MRRAIFWFGWVILLALPVVFAVQIYLTQDLPHVEPWKWLVPLAAIGVIYFARNRDDVFRHHLA